jgi:hypothetical protein
MVVGLLVVAVVVGQEAAHAVRQVLAVTDSLSFTKSLEYEQSVRHPWWHSSQHHRP